MAFLSLLLVSRDPGPALGRLVASWDGQSASLDDFEVVVIDAGSTDGTADRLHQLAERRPNVTVLHASSDLDDDALLTRALERATGGFVVWLRQTQRLTPRAVELFKQQAEASGADLVLGRAVSASGTGTYHLPAQLEVITSEQALLAWPGSCAAIRREVLLGSPGPAAALGNPETLLSRSGTVAAAGTTAVVTDIDLTTGDESALQLAESQVRWEGGVLQFETRAVLPEPIEGDPAAWLIAARTDGLAEIAVPTSVELSDQPADPDSSDDAQQSIRLRATLDPATADSGAELADGIWNLRIRLAFPGWESTAALPPVKVASAVVEGRLFTLPAPRGGQQLDVGATRSSVIGAARMSDAAVVESVAGSLLTLRYPNLHVHGDSVVSARLRLDSFSLPAQLLGQDGEARLECFVSGLAGSSVITVLAGRGKPSPTGLSLKISGTGQMTIEPTPATPTPAAPAAATGRVGAADATPPSSVPLVQRLRRLAPASIDPVIGRLSRVEPLRDLYRRLIGR